MSSTEVRTRDVGELARDQQEGLARWRGDLERRLQRDPEQERDREAQMDARRELAGLHRTEEEVAALQARRSRPSSGSGRTRAVVVHRSEWLRARLVKELQDQGAEVVGQGEDGAEAVAFAVVEQPDLMILEDRLPWVMPLEVVREARDYAPRTFVAVLVEAGVEADRLLEAGAHAVLGRTVKPHEVISSCLETMAHEGWRQSA
jgi:CheY-like chemotaxis protein